MGRGRVFFFLLTAPAILAAHGLDHARALKTLGKERDCSQSIAMSTKLDLGSEIVKYYIDNIYKMLNELEFYFLFFSYNGNDFGSHTVILGIVAQSFEILGK